MEVAPAPMPLQISLATLSVAVGASVRVLPSMITRVAPGSKNTGTPDIVVDTPGSNVSPFGSTIF